MNTPTTTLRRTRDRWANLDELGDEGRKDELSLRPFTCLHTEMVKNKQARVRPEPPGQFR